MTELRDSIERRGRILSSFGVYAFTWKENESSCYSNAKELMFLMFPYFLSIVSFVIMISWWNIYLYHKIYIQHMHIYQISQLEYTLIMNSKINQQYLYERRQRAKGRERRWMTMRMYGREWKQEKCVNEREPPYLYGYPATYRWHDYAATMLQFSL